MVRGKNAAFGACFHRHVGDGKALLYIQKGDRFPGKFQSFIVGSFGPDLVNKKEDNIFGQNSLGKIAAQNNLIDFGYSKPGFAGANCHGNIR